VVSERECATPETPADLILASSCSSPMTSSLRWKGRYLLDGGPVSAWDYTSPEGIQFAYDLGRRDGAEFLTGPTPGALGRVRT